MVRRPPGHCRLTGWEALETRLLLAADVQVELTPVVSGLTSPLVATHAGDSSNRLFIAEQTGTIRILQDGQLRSAPFLQLGAGGLNRVLNGGERGLLGLAFHPRYADQTSPHAGKFYVYYSAPATLGGDHDSVVSEFRVSTDPNIADPASERELLRFRQPFSNHNGGDIHFGPDDGLLYIATGDGGSGGDPLNNAQDLSNLLGKILRIDVNGANAAGGRYGIPATNPFLGQANTRPEIFAYGLRNPYRFSFDDGPTPESVDRLFAGDVGQSRWEEVDLITSGGNYGWRIREGAHPFNSSDPNPGNLIDPIAEYPNDATTDSVIGGYVYRGTQSPALQGLYLFGDLTGRMFVLDDSTGDFVLSDLNVAGGNPIRQGIIGFGEDEAGELYVLTFNSLLAIRSTEGVLEGRVFHDRNQNAENDTGEEFLNGWTVELVDQAGTVVAAQQTEMMDRNGDGSIDPLTESGWYQFEVDPAQYTVRQVFRAGWQQTAPFPETLQTAFELDVERDFFTVGNLWENWGGTGEKWLQARADGRQWFYITPAGHLYEWDNQSGRPLGSPLGGELIARLGTTFYQEPLQLIDAEPPPLALATVNAGETTRGPDFGNVALNSVEGRLFHDLNGSGTQDANERFLNDWTVELLDTDGRIVARQQTGDRDLDGDGSIDPTLETGWYEFAAVESGEYRVQQVPPSGWIQTTPSLDDIARVAYLLDQDRNFYSDGNLWEDWGGQQEKWLQSAREQGQWYYLTPQGELFRWDNVSEGTLENPLRGELVATLDTRFYEDPLALVDIGSVALQISAGSGAAIQDFGVRQS